jgi:hypothetical protein
MESKRALFKFYRSYFEVGQELSDADRLAFYDALFNRQFFGIEPNLKGISKLAYISQKHSIDAQIKGWEEKTKTKLLDPIIGGSVGGMQGGSIQVKEEVKEQEKEEEKVKEEHLPASPKFSFLGALIEYGFDRQLVEDWLKVRKTKKATNTQTAFNKFIEEVEQRSCNINEILEICVEKSWSGFKWTWVDNLKQTNTFNNGRVEKTPEQLASDIFNSETARNFRFS